MPETTVRPGCLSHADIAAILDGSAPAPALASAHLEACQDCQAAAEWLSRVPGLDGRLAEWMLAERHRFTPRAFPGPDTPVPAELTSDELPRYDSAPPDGFQTVGPPGLPAGPATRTLGKYRLLRRLGEGGMGVVWEAEDTRLHRRVALKEVRPEFTGNAGIRERFLREARLLAGVSHDHVVVIHDQGEDAGEFFLVMELLTGEPLDRLIARAGPLPAEEALRIGREAALGLAAVHARGLVHRDIKPANLFLQSPGGRVKLLDLGLARRAEGGPAFTRSGVAVGTPNYMPPEQAEGKPIDARTDLFSLGCVLYHALTGKPPFRGDNPAQVMSAVLRDEPVPVSRLRPDMPNALADLIDRLLSKDAARRPASAAAVADELARIQPTPPRSWATWAVAAALLAGAVLSGFVIIKIVDRDGKETTLKVLAGSMVEFAADGAVKVTLPAGARKPEKKVAPPKPNPAWRAPEAAKGIVSSLAVSRDGTHLLFAATDGHVRWWDMVAGREALSFKFRDGLGGFAALSPDGKSALTLEGQQRLRLWDLVNNKEAAAWQTPGRWALAPPVFTPDGTRAFVAHSVGESGPPFEVCLWDLKAHKVVRSFKHPSSISCLAVAPDGKRLLTHCNDRKARLWSVDDEKELSSHSAPTAMSWFGLAVSPDGKFALSCEHAAKPGGGRGLVPVVRILELADDRLTVRPGVAGFGGLTAPGSAVAWSPDGKRLAYATTNGHVAVWSFPEVKLVDAWGLDGPVKALAFSPDNRQLAVSAGKAIKFLQPPAAIPAAERRDWQPNELVAILGTHKEHDKASVTTLAFSRDGRRLLAGSRDDHARLWDVNTGKLLLSNRGRKDCGIQAALSPDGKLAVLVSWHQNVRVWGLEANKELASFGRGEGEVVLCPPVFLPGGKGFFLAHRDRHAGPSTVRLYDTATMAEKKSYPHPKPPGRLGQAYVSEMAVSPDGKRLVTATHDSFLRLWDVASGKKLSEMEMPISVGIGQVAWSPDGRYLLTGEYARTDVKARTVSPCARVREWQGDELKPFATYTAEDNPNAVAWASDSKSLAFADLSGRIVVRDFPSGKKRASWWMRDAVSSLAFSPDGRLLAVGTRYAPIYLLRLPGK